MHHICNENTAFRYTIILEVGVGRGEKSCNPHQLRIPSIHDPENGGLHIGRSGLGTEEDTLSDEPLDRDLQASQRAATAAHHSDHILDKHLWDGLFVLEI